MYEANVTDEDAYNKALPEVQKIIKENGGVYLAGGFNKAKTDLGKPAAGNRFVIIRYDSEAAFDKFWNGGGKAWIEKYAPQARSVSSRGRRTEITRVRRRAAQVARCISGGQACCQRRRRASGVVGTPHRFTSAAACVATPAAWRCWRRSAGPRPG